MRRSCAFCFQLPYLSTLFKPRKRPSEEVDRDRVEPPVNYGLSRTHSVAMAAVNADRGPTKEGISVDSTAAIKSNHRVGANGESHATNGVVTNGQSHSEISGLRVTLRPRPIQLTPRYRDGFRRTNQDALDATTSMKSFFDFVANDRLRRMPHKGSRWDKILRWAEYFAAQVSLYHESVGPFVSNSEETAQLLWASCRILLQVSIC